MWYYVHQSDSASDLSLIPDDFGFGEQLPPQPIFPSPSVEFDNEEFQHQLTFVIPPCVAEPELPALSQGQYLCYPRGLVALQLFQSPGNITVNVLEG